MLHRTRHAFTMIEMLVVISIIAVLAALILTGAQALGIGSKKEKTRTILAAVSKGINLTIANKGGSISPVEHPLAGSRAPRFQFKRFMPPSDTGTGAVASGAALDTAGMALAGLNATSQLPGGASGTGSADLMLPSDLYADQASYLLFGLKREYIGTLGALQKRVTKYLLLPKPLTGQASLPSTFPALTSTALPQYTIPTDSQDSDSTFGHPSANKQAIDYVFGSSNVQAELSSLNALYMADPTAAAMTTAGGTVLATPENAFRNAINPKLITSSASPPSGVPIEATSLAMLYTDAKPEVTWKPGCIYVTGGVPDYNGSNTQNSLMLASGAGGGGGGMWVHYRLPGLAIYDAWKNEVLYTISSQGGIRLMSAGADGVFQFSPGPNHILDSTDPELDPVGDDTNGSKDNVVQRVEEQQ